MLDKKKEYLKQYSKYVYKQDPGYVFENIQDVTLKNYFSSVINENFLKSHFDEHRGYTKRLYSELGIKFSYKPYAHRIHYETISKVLSTVVYVAPTHNIGTIIFNEDKSFHGVITWKPNRALVFAPKTDITWHTYGNWEKDKRLTIDYFLKREEIDFSLS